VTGVQTCALPISAIFDLGVFLCVVGAVLLALNSLSRIARRAGETTSDDPYSIDPPATGPEGR
jgi:multicomponent K+:H+ antiporter subunit A